MKYTSFKTKLSSALLLMLNILVLCVKGQAPNIQWTRGYGGAASPGCFGNSVKVDNFGNSFTAGVFSGTIDFDPGSGIYNLSSPAGQHASFILKLDPLGNFIWVKTFVKFGNTGGAWNGALTLDNYGGVYVAGSYSGIVDFNPGIGTTTMSTLGGRLFVAKLDTAGNFHWVKNFGSSAGTPATAGIATDSHGNVYCNGYFQYTTNFDPSASNYTLTSSQDNAYILKLDSAGNFGWAKQFSGSSNRSGSIDIDASDNIYVAGGYTSGTIDFDPGMTTYTVVTTTAHNVFITKLNSLGNFVWVKTLNASPGLGGSCVKTDHSGNVFITGGFNDIIDVDPGSTTHTVGVMGDVHCYVLKLNSFGNFVWAKDFGGPLIYGSDGYGIDFDQLNNVYALGRFANTVDFDPGVSTHTVTSRGITDGYILKLDSSGNFSWVKTLGGVNSENAFSIAMAPYGDVYVTGTFQDTCDFNVGGPSYTLASGGNENAFYVYKIGQCNIPSAPTDITPSVNKTICANTQATLSVSGLGTTTWYQTPSSTSILATGNTFVTPTLGLGTYTYYVQAYTCTNSINRTAIKLTVNSCSGLVESDYTTSRKIFPNPFKDFVSVEATTSSELVITDLSGAIVLKTKLSEGKNEINTSSLKPGMYLIQVSSSNGGENVWRGKFVKVE